MQPASEDKKPKSSGMRLPVELSEKIGELVKLLPGTSINSFCVSCVEAILTLTETPESQRITPAIVLMLDSVRKPGPILTSQPSRPLELNDHPSVSTRLLKKAKETTK